MASQLPDDITTLPATFDNVGKTVNALLAFARAWEAATGKNGVKITQSDGNVVIEVSAAGSLPANYTYEEFTICVDGSPETRWWPTWTTDPTTSA